MDQRAILSWAPWVALLGAAVYMLMSGSDFILHLATVTAIYAALAISLNLAFGYTGLFSIAHASLFGIGAYGAGILLSRFGMPFPAAIALGALVSGAVGAAIAAIFSKMDGPYFAIGTFALGELVRIILNEWRSVTGGPMGLSVPRPTLDWFFVTLDLNDRPTFFAVAAVLLGATAGFVALLLRSRLGARMTHVRDDPNLAASLGVPVLRTKIYAFFMSGVLAGLAGGLFGIYLQFIAPSSFSGMESVRLVMMVVIGGAATMFGPVVGAAVIVLLPQALRMDPTDSLICTGLILIAVVLFMPKGIVGSLAPLLRRKARPGPAIPTSMPLMPDRPARAGNGG
jgi:branched-chain amino acid transport system permease protein